MRISVIQMNQGSDKPANLDQARRLIEGALASDRPDLITLPETWTNLGGGREAREAAAEILPEPGGTGGVAYEFMRSVAVSQGITVHGGSIIERGPEKLFNTTVVFDSAGAEIARYRKIHLFDITGPDGTGYRESALYGAGDKLVTCRVGDVTLGLTICYDMRFAEQYMSLRRVGADVIFVPSNFTLQTGKDHWEVMLRTRAIESQCWIAAAPSCRRSLPPPPPTSARPCWPRSTTWPSAPTSAISSRMRMCSMRWRCRGRARAASRSGRSWTPSCATPTAD